jgi:hypothetical protein
VRADLDANLPAVVVTNQRHTSKGCSTFADKAK